ncbi:MAG: 4-phosphopantetheinyl transferase [Gemmatimonadetes bacterium]|nr:4-phosphopantetheinyl transferase [Gemmatimonadota bacterium]
MIGVDPGTTPSVQLWEVRTSGPVRATLLNASERARANRMASPGTRRLFVTCRTALRVILGDALGLPPLSIALVAGAGGKPALDMPAALSFNVSHSGDVALIALARGVNVGVDVERVPDDVAALAAVEAYLTPRERRELIAHLPAEHPGFVTAAWTRREALLKGRGAGISEVGLRRDPTTDPDWTVRDVEMPPGYRAALAVELPCWTGLVTRERFTG